jgi:hypothetical protein
MSGTISTMKPTSDEGKMLYRVTVHERVRQDRTVIVEASDAEEAEEKALHGSVVEDMGVFDLDVEASVVSVKRLDPLEELKRGASPRASARRFKQE